MQVTALRSCETGQPTQRSSGFHCPALRSGDGCAMRRTKAAQRIL
jgi:hypothetical protein